MYAAIMKFGGTLPLAGADGSPLTVADAVTRCAPRITPPRSSPSERSTRRREVVTDPEWDGVAHVQTETDLNAYLGEPG